ncbi:MAG: hypothetical protein KTR31_32100 [Myxococcales bacterium]|nr:hypothetical protein [Myxococcales bacterium]
MIHVFLHLLFTAAMAAPPTGLTVTAPTNNGGLNLVLEWRPASDDATAVAAYAVARADAPEGPFRIVTDGLPPGTATFQDKVTTNARTDPPKGSYWYRVITVPTDHPPFEVDDEDPESRVRQAQEWLAALPATEAVRGDTVASLFNLGPGHMVLLFLIVAVGGLMALFTRQAREGKPIFIRRIPGIDAIEEGIGRATEMGRPVLYVPGIDELQDIQTIASMLILGQVSRTVAEYQADIVVSCCIPIVREVADEVVKAGFFQAGHPDAFNPANIRFISSEQFAFTAGTNGIIHREKPATNLYLGRFFAESLILAETGYVNKSIQIAGTAEATQLPFFIAACDYTLIGEELFAVSAYLSNDPRLVSSLKASDYVKVAVVIALILGTLEATLLGSSFVGTLFTIAEGG